MYETSNTQQLRNWRVESNIISTMFSALVSPLWLHHTCMPFLSIISLGLLKSIIVILESHQAKWTCTREAVACCKCSHAHHLQNQPPTLSNLSIVLLKEINTLIDCFLSVLKPLSQAWIVSMKSYMPSQSLNIGMKRLSLTHIFRPPHRYHPLLGDLFPPTVWHWAPWTTGVLHAPSLSSSGNTVERWNPLLQRCD